MQMSVKVKLLAGFLATAGLGALAGVMGIISIGTMGEQTNIIIEDVPRLKMGKELHFEQKAMRVNLLELTLVRENMDNFQHYRDNYREKLTETNKRIDALLYGSEELGVQAARTGGEIERLTNKVKEELVHFTQVADELISYKEGLLEDVIAGTITMEAAMVEEGLEVLARERLPAATKSLEEATELVAARAGEQMHEAEIEAEAVQASSTMILFVVLGIGVGAAIVVGLFLATNISKPILKVVKVAQAIAKGDLSSEDVKIKSKDAIGQLGTALNEMSANLNDMVSQVASAASQIASSTQQLSATSEEMAAGAEEQTSQTSQVATSVEEMSATIQEVAKNAKDASDSSGEAGKTAEEGGKIVGQTVSEMQKIAKSVSDLQVVIQGLNKNSEKIGDIVGVIDDVADQTNLLALNAAIEAARAGEQGRGFAVVADEVRKLAERTTSSTKEIADMVKSIQGDTSQAVSSMEEAGKEVKEGVGVAGKAGDALKKIMEMSQGVNQIVQQIATAAEQQAAASEEISSNVESIASVSKQSASGAQQTSSAAQELSSLTDNLQSLVNQFKLRNGGKVEAKVERASIKKEKVAPVEQVKVAKAKKKKAA